MTIFDFFFIGLLFASAILGTFRGLVGELIALLALLVAVFAAWMYRAQAAVLFESVIDNPLWREIAAGALIVFAVLALAGLLQALLRSLLKAAGLRPTDRFFGMLFGILRGVGIAVLLVAGGAMLDLDQETWWEQARFMPPLEHAVLVLKPLLPAELAEKISFR